MDISAIRQRLEQGVADDRATSPTIGAILLVGITVVVAMTIGGHVFQFSEPKQKPFAVASVNFDKTGDRVSVVWRANSNADKLVVTVSVDDHHQTVTLHHVGQKVVVDDCGTKVHKGDADSWDHPATTNGDEASVTVVAKKDGDSIVIAERTETL